MDNFIFLLQIITVIIIIIIVIVIMIVIILLTPTYLKIPLIIFYCGSVK
jgi:hypothetical protein